MSTRHGFWVLVEDNRVFDGIVTQHLVAHGDIAVINAFYNSAAYPPYRNIVQRLHAAKPGFRVLFYTWAGRKRMEGRPSIGVTPTLDGMEHEDLLRNADGTRFEATINDQSFIFLDPRIADARTWLRGRVSEVMSKVGSDGVGLDSAIRSPGFLSQFVGYPEAFDSMIQGVSEATPITIFNGLTRSPDQEGLLAYAQGASIEYFGLNDKTTRKPTFASDILPYLEAIGRHDRHTFLVFGRASRKPQPYTTYDEDWLWQRYLYCAYLLAAGKNTRWKHHAGFLASPNSGRAGGLDVYADALHNLEPALGDYTVEGGCYRRAFKGGVVLIVPTGTKTPQSVRINRPMFTLEGKRVFAGQVSVAPGEGQVLLHSRPAPPPALVRQFDSGLNPGWRWSEMRQESGAWYLHLDATQDGEESEHDLALDLVRYRTPRGQVTLWYRTSDTTARVKIVVEVDDRGRVDDKHRGARFALVDGAGDKPPRQPAQFRAVAPDISQFKRLPVVGGRAPLIADGRWHTLVIDLDAACAASGRYEFRRAVFARLLGSMDIRGLRLASR